MPVNQEDVIKALMALEEQLGEDVVKASEEDLDQPEGADLGQPSKKKMSEEAPEGEEKSLKAKKSFVEEAPEEIQTKIDVSEFLKSLVEHTGSSIDSLRSYVAKSDLASENRYNDLANAIDEIQESQAKIGVVLKALCEQVGVIKSAPARAPKADTVAKSEGREFKSALEEEVEEKVFKSLSNDPAIAKSQMSEALCDLVKKGEASDLDVIGFESGGYVRPELVSKLKSVLN